MAILKTKEIHTFDKAEIDDKLNELRAALMEERSKLRSTGVTDKPAAIRNIKRTIARLETIRRVK